MGGYYLTTTLLLLFILLMITSTTSSLCDRAGCKCNTTAHQMIIITCSFDAKQVVELNSTSLPAATMELEVTRCRELRLLAGALSDQRGLQRVQLRNVERLIMRRHAFLNFSANHAFLEVMECGSVVFETYAFRYINGPLSILISRCGHAIIQGTAFSWLLNITVTDVPRLELLQNAFSFESPFRSRHGPATTVLLKNVIISELPPNTFPSSAAELRFVDVEIRTIRRDAFCAMTLFAVLFYNSSFHNIEEGAFSDRTLVTSFVMDGVRLHEIQGGAIQAAFTNLTIKHSRILKVLSGSLNITVAAAILTDNSFETVYTGGIAFKNWNRITIENNKFERIETEAFVIPYQPVREVDAYDLKFSGNEILGFGSGALNFIAYAAKYVSSGLRVKFLENKFAQPCRCNLTNWINVMLTPTKISNQVIEDFYNSSYCTVNAVLARCFNVAEGFLNMYNFTELVCSSRDVIVCEELSRRAVVMGGEHDTRVSTAGMGVAFENEANNEKKVIGVIFIAVVCGIVLVLLITVSLWMKKKGHFIHVQTICLPIFSQLLEHFRERGLMTATSARSISRLSTREYAELQQQQQKQRRGILVLPDEETGDNMSEDEEIEYVEYEDKWTQTLPEELTQELLQSLREKLDDPEKYGEARDMIEHLYDLIKVEESCNNNNTPSTSQIIDQYEDDDSLYDVIRPTRPVSHSSRSRYVNGGVPGKTRRNTCSVGTRVPSPDKLLPAASYTQLRKNQPATLIAEYIEPKDREQHLYTELPSGKKTVSPAPSPVASPPSYHRGPARPLSFLRQLGENLPFVGSKFQNNISNNVNQFSGTCEYSEPTDVTSVSMLSDSSDPPKCFNKMANRPLPNKPEDDPGEGTSASSG